MHEADRTPPQVIAGAPPSFVRPSFRDALRFWFKLGFISFGGPTGQIAIMHEEVVDRRRWIGEPQFLHALNYCMLLPGPEAQQLATYIGWLLHGALGGVVAGVLFVLPSVVILWTLSYVYVSHGDVAWIAAIFHWLKPAVIAIVAHAVWRIGRRSLKTPLMWAVAAGSFAAIFCFRAPFPAIIVSAGLLGLGLSRTLSTNADPAPFATSTASAQRSLGRSLRVLIIHLALWWTPIAAAGLLLGRDHAVTQQGIFFSKAALMTFGGAYAVLPYVAEQAVDRYAWLSAPQMLDGLGLAETTPGPLIMVLQFVGFLGGWRHPGPLSPLTAATLGALMTTWVTFVPCFLWILLGAPYVETMRRNARISAALTAISAAVVGVVLNLAVWFAQGVLLPESGQVDFAATAVCVAAFAAMFSKRIGVPTIVAAAALLGLATTAF